MKFNIIHINNDRAIYHDVIRANLDFEEVDVPAFNGYEDDPVEGLKTRGLNWWGWGNAKRGELSVWISHYDCWGYADMLGDNLIVFEDDASPAWDFMQQWNNLITDLPSDWDVFTLWVPDNQRIDYYYDVVYNENGHPAINGTRTDGSSYYDIGSTKIAKTYQGYGMVANVYSPNGGRKLVDIAHQRGVTTPVDCWLYEEIHKGNLNGYAPRPDFCGIVEYDWGPSQVQQTERVL